MTSKLAAAPSLSVVKFFLTPIRPAFGRIGRTSERSTARPPGSPARRMIFASSGRGAAVSGMGTRIFAAPVASVVAALSYFRAGFVERLVLQPGGKTLERGQWRLAGGVNLRISVLVQA
jgi:hypothetical protein